MADKKSENIATVEAWNPGLTYDRVLNGLGAFENRQVVWQLALALAVLTALHYIIPK